MRTLTLSLSLLAVAVPSLAAQERLALASGARSGMPPVVERAITAALLRPSYRMRLVSDWPQLSAGGLACVNGGQEMLEGTLIQTGEASYAGQFRRQATIRFCGAHGSADQPCTLTLTSDGNVAASGSVAQTRGDWTSPEIEVRWTTPEGASAVVVEGDCSPGFNDKLRAMYLGAAHSLEFSLPPAGEERRTMRLDDYGWIVDVQ